MCERHFINLRTMKNNPVAISSQMQVPAGQASGLQSVIPNPTGAGGSSRGREDIMEVDQQVGGSQILLPQLRNLSSNVATTLLTDRGTQLSTLPALTTDAFG